MRRTALLLGMVAAAGALAVAAAGAADKRTYQAELFNAFGLVEGSELRIAGVKAGTITDLDVTAEKTALVSFEVGPEFPELRSDASCSSEPQSLIAEYFLNCQPGSAADPLEGPIEAARNQTTVQNDLVQNTLREPFKRRFQLVLNEFGTALVGNGENLNAAIRSGAPALRELSKVLKILGRQNRIIAQLNTDSDAVFQQLTDRREDVVRFIDEAEDAGRISAERREDLAADFDLLDDFLVELRPVMHELGNVARENTPLLTDLRAAAPGLNRLANRLPGFNDATRVSLESLGGAAEVGDRALGKSTDEISELNVTAQKSFRPVDQVATFLESLDDPDRAVEEDCNARYDLREQPGEADRRVARLEADLGINLTGRHDIPASSVNVLPCDVDPGSPTGNPGYTGLEGLLNYAYYQAGSLNVFDAAGHALQIHIVGATDLASEGPNGECGHFWPGPEWPAAEEFITGGTHAALAPEANDGYTGNPRFAAHCVAPLGDYQPGVGTGLFDPDTGLTDFIPGAGNGGELRRYDQTVCPDGSTRSAMCDPGIPNLNSAFEVKGAAPEVTMPPAGQEPTDEEIDDVLDELTEGVEKTLDQIRDQLGLPPGAPLPPEIIDALRGDASGDGGAATQAPGAAPAVPPSPQSAAANDLMDYLFGP